MHRRRKTTPPSAAPLATHRLKTAVFRKSFSGVNCSFMPNKLQFCAEKLLGGTR